jgi:hypothetical protein
MKGLIIALGVNLLPLSGTRANDGDSIGLDELLQAAKLPEGYRPATQDLKVADKVAGRMIVIDKPGQVSKVVVRVELRDLSAVPARRAAAKAYINSLASSLAESGYRLVEKKLPDIGTETFEKPISVELVFANRDGKKPWTREEIFFTDKGFVVQVIAEDADTLVDLTKWAKTIKPAPKP